MKKHPLLGHAPLPHILLRIQIVSCIIAVSSDFPQSIQTNDFNPCKVGYTSASRLEVMLRTNR